MTGCASSFDRQRASLHRRTRPCKPGPAPGSLPPALRVSAHHAPFPAAPDPSAGEAAQPSPRPGTGTGLRAAAPPHRRRSP